MFHLQIEDPSGEVRSQPLKKDFSHHWKVGRDPSCDVILRDPTVASFMALIRTLPTDRSKPSLLTAGASPFWIQMQEGTPSAVVGDLTIREANLPEGIPIKIGETTMTLEKRISTPPLPDFPVGVRPWLTQSESGKNLLWMCKKSAPTPLSLYIGGETGTGKEVIAHLLHAWSQRASGPFIPLNCAALPLSLVESELFGHVKGSFTGAVNHRPGALMQAHGGTLFLDEVGDLPMDIQVKLLRFLENGEIKPVGADKTSRADVRVLCATHLHLKRLVEEGKFRRDLFYRLTSVMLEIPSLRTRPEDVELLAQRFANDLDRKLTPRAMLRLKAHTWPGNVRELRHAIERASGLAGPFTPTLTEDAFEFLLASEHVKQNPDLEFGAGVLTLEEMERVMLLKALKMSGGNRTQASKILGVARSTLFEMLKRHKIYGPKILLG